MADRACGPVGRAGLEPPEAPEPVEPVEPVPMTGPPGVRGEETLTADQMTAVEVSMLQQRCQEKLAGLLVFKYTAEAMAMNERQRLREAKLATGVRLDEVFKRPAREPDETEEESLGGSTSVSADA